MLKKLQAVFLGLSLLGITLVTTGLIVDNAEFWILVDGITIAIFAGSVIVYYQSLRN